MQCGKRQTPLGPSAFEKPIVDLFDMHQGLLTRWMPDSFWPGHGASGRVDDRGAGASLRARLARILASNRRSAFGTASGTWAVAVLSRELGPRSAKSRGNIGLSAAGKAGGE